MTHTMAYYFSDRLLPAAFCAVMIFHEALKTCLSRCVYPLPIFVAKYRALRLYFYCKWHGASWLMSNGHISMTIGHITIRAVRSTVPVDQSNWRYWLLGTSYARFPAMRLAQYLKSGHLRSHQKIQKTV